MLTHALTKLDSNLVEEKKLQMNEFSVRFFKFEHLCLPGNHSPKTNGFAMLRNFKYNNLIKRALIKRFFLVSVQLTTLYWETQ